ncbi:MAG: RDD family protein [Syntrophomonas sp.]|nr:RDD family protein [Syntrophomonas sp.]
MTEYDENIPTHEPETNVVPTGEIAPIMYRAAGFWVRLLAFTIDLLVIAGLNAIIWDSLLPAAATPSFLNQVLHTNALFLGLTGAAYFIIMTHYFQQTLGKMIVGIKVIQHSGEPLSWITVVFRELVARSLSQIMGLNLGYMVCWFNTEKRCAHDFLSDTWVVYEKPGGDSHYISVEAGKAT